MDRKCIRVGRFLLEAYFHTKYDCHLRTPTSFKAFSSPNSRRLSLTVGLSHSVCMFQVRLTSSSPVVGVRYAWEGYPQCILYNGLGGPDDHAGLPSAPFRHCVYGTPENEPAWRSDCLSHSAAAVPFNPAGAAVPSVKPTDFLLLKGSSL
eukprot:6198259-Pleurochrysis_carterae.AAC.2